MSGAEDARRIAKDREGYTEDHGGIQQHHARTSVPSVCPCEIKMLNKTLNNPHHLLQVKSIDLIEIIQLIAIDIQYQCNVIVLECR